MHLYEQDIKREARIILREEGYMVQLRSLAAFLGALMICSILSSGCSGQPGASQPPASTLTIPTTTRQATPVPMTPTPVQPGTTTNPPTPGVTPSWTPGTVAQSGATILITGDVVGLKSTRGNFIDEIRFTVVKAPRVEPVTFEIPNTQIIFTKFGVQFGTNYQIIGRHNDNGDNILDEGESFDISVPIQTPYEIYTGQKFTMAIKNPPQSQVIVTTETPPVLSDSNILARAPS
jgi:hypothetical protein